MFFLIILFPACSPEPSDNGFHSVDDLIVWQGSREEAPDNPEAGWAYYNSAEGISYIYLQGGWRILAQDGLSISWLGEMVNPPANPSRNDAYFNTVDGNSYIWDGSEWDYLAKRGGDGSSGILKWYGDRTEPITDPKDGDAYHNTQDKTSYIYYSGKWNILAQDGYGITWIGAYNGAPSGNHEVNSVYFDTGNGNLYIWTGTNWDVFSEATESYIEVPIEWKGELSTAPSDPAVGWTYYNASTGASYIWDGAVWEEISRDGQDGTSPEGFLIQWQGSMASAPSKPEAGWAYYNSLNNTAYLYDGNRWNILIEGGGTGIVAESYSYEVLIDGKTYASSDQYMFGTMIYGKDKPKTIVVSVKNTGNNTIRFRLTPEEYYQRYSKAVYYSDLYSVADGDLQYEIEPGKTTSFNVTIGYTENTKTYQMPNAMLPIGFTLADGTTFVMYTTGGFFGPSLTFSLYHYAPWGDISKSNVIGSGVTDPSISITDVEVGPAGIDFSLSLSAYSGGNDPEYIPYIRSALISGTDSSYFSIVEGMSTNSYTLLFTPDSTREYSIYVDVRVSYAGNEMVFSFPISIDCTYSPYNPTSSFFDKEGKALFDSREGDGDDRFSIMVEKPDGGLYIIGTGWELVSGYSDHDAVVLELDSQDRLVGMYKADNIAGQNITNGYFYGSDGLVLEDGRILIIYNSTLSYLNLDVDTITSDSKTIGTSKHFRGIWDDILWYMDKTGIAGFTPYGDSSYTISFSNKLDEASAFWYGKINDTETIIAGGYKTNLKNDHSDKDAVLMLYQNDGSNWNLVKDWSWDAGHYDDDYVSNVVSDGKDIYAVIYSEDYINGWTSAYRLIKLSISEESQKEKSYASDFELIIHDGAVYALLDDTIRYIDIDTLEIGAEAIILPGDFSRKTGKALYRKDAIYYGYTYTNVVNSHSKNDWVIRCIDVK